MKAEVLFDSVEFGQSSFGKTPEILDTVDVSSRWLNVSEANLEVKDIPAAMSEVFRPSNIKSPS